MSDSIQVAVRVRPLLKRECGIHWHADQNTITQTDPNNSSKLIGNPYVFDQIIDQDQTTEHVYKKVAHPIVEGFMEGMNGTIFAYGQTASGKTFTIAGNEEHPGVIPRTVDHIFNTIAQAQNQEYLIRVSYMEIYNEKLSDLLDVHDKPMKIRETTSNVVYISDLKEEVVSDHSQILDLLKKGDAKRRVGETQANEKSSRSHAIFRFILESRERNAEDAEGVVKVSHLNLVDLAGSERVSLTGATGERFKEGCHINSSLSVLTQVIYKLSQGDTFINYRDSKLTRILQNALGGNSKTAIICAITPADVEFSLSTLKFAMNAKKIKNKPVVNEILSDEALMKRYKKEINELKKELEKQKGSGSNPDLEKEKADLHKLLMEKEEKERAQEEKIANLRKFILQSGSPDTQEMPMDTMQKKKIEMRKRRETWCPGLLQSHSQVMPPPFSSLPTVPPIAVPSSVPQKPKKPKIRRSIYATRYPESSSSDEFKSAEVFTAELNNKEPEASDPGPVTKRKRSRVQFETPPDKPSFTRRATEYKRRIAIYQRTIKRLDIKNDELQSRIEELENEMFSKMSQAVASPDADRTLNLCNISLSTEMQSAELEALREEVRGMNGLEKQIEELKYLKEEVALLRPLLPEVEALRKIKDEVEGLRKIKKEYESIQKTNCEAEMLASMAQAKLERVTMEKKLCEEKIAELEVAATDNVASSELESLNTQLGELQNVLESEREESRVAMEKLREEFVTIQTELAASKEEVSTLKAAADKSVEEFRSAAEKIQSLEEKLEVLREVRTEFEELQRKDSESMERLTMFDKLIEENRDLEMRAAELKEKLEAATAKCANVADLESARILAEEKCDEIRKELERVSTECEELKNRVERSSERERNSEEALNSLHEEHTSAVKLLEEQKSLLETRLKNVQDEFGEMSKHFESLKTKEADSVAEREELSKELSEVLVKLQEAKERISVLEMNNSGERSAEVELLRKTLAEKDEEHQDVVEKLKQEFAEFQEEVERDKEVLCSVHDEIEKELAESHELYQVTLRKLDVIEQEREDLESEVIAFEKEKTEGLALVERLVQEKADLDSALSGKNVEIEQLHMLLISDADSGSSGSGKLQEKLTALEIERDELVKKNEILVDERESFEKELRESLEVVRLERDELVEKIKLSQVDKEANENALKERFNAVEAEREQTCDELASVMHERDSLKNLFDELKSESESLQKKLEERQSEVERLQAERNCLVEKLEAFGAEESSVADLKEKLGVVESECAELRTFKELYAAEKEACESLKTKLAEVSVSVETEGREDVKELCERIKVLEADVKMAKSFEEELEVVSRVKSDLETRLQTLSAEKEELENRLSLNTNVENEQNSVQKKLEDSGAEKDGLEMQFKEKCEQIERLEVSLNDATIEVTVLKADLENLRASTSDVDQKEELDELQQLVDTLICDKEYAESLAEERLAEIDQLEKCLRVSEQGVEDLKKKYEENDAAKDKECEALQELCDSYKSGRDEADSLQMELAKLQSSFDELLDEKYSMLEDHQSLNRLHDSEVESLRSSLETLMREKLAVESLIEEHAAEIERLEKCVKDLEECRDELKRSTEEHDSGLKSDLCEAQELCNLYKNERESLENALQEHKSENALLNELVEGLKSEKLSLESTQNELKSLFEEKCNQLDDMDDIQKKLEETLRELDTVRETLFSVENEREQTCDELASVMRERDSLKNSFDELKSESESLQKKLEERQSEVEGLQKMIEDSTTKLSEMHSAYEKMKACNADLSQQLTNVSKMKDQLQIMFSSSRKAAVTSGGEQEKQIANLKAEIRQLEGVIGDQQRNSEQDDLEYAELKKQFEEEQEKTAKLGAKIKELESSSAAGEEQKQRIAKLQKEIHGLECLNEVLQRNSAQDDEEYAELKKEYEGEQEKCQQLEKKLKELEAAVTSGGDHEKRITKLKQEVRELERLNEVFQRNSAQDDEEYAELKKQYEEEQEKCQQLEKKLKELEDGAQTQVNSGDAAQTISDLKDKVMELEVKLMKTEIRLEQDLKKKDSEIKFQESRVKDLKDNLRRATARMDDTFREQAPKSSKPKSDAHLATVMGGSGIIDSVNNMMLEAENKHLKKENERLHKEVKSKTKRVTALEFEYNQLAGPKKNILLEDLAERAPLSDRAQQNFLKMELPTEKKKAEYPFLSDKEAWEAKFNASQAKPDDQPDQCASQ